MCGLFAIVPVMPVSAEFAQRLRFLFKALAKSNDSRGGHSWGMWSYDWEPYKGLGSIGDDPEALCLFTDLWKPKRLGWIAGHTRFGTHGGRTVNNSHPFTHGKLTLAHNGVVTVNIKDAEVQAHVVDSGQLCIGISKYGLEAAIGKTSGMIGLLFSNNQTRQFYAYRSDQVLHIAKCPWGYAISSDKKHLKDSLEFCGFFDAEISSLEENMVSAPWYETFVPFEVKSAGRPTYSYQSNYDWRSYQDKSGYGTYQGKGGSTSKWDKSKTVWKDGRWQSTEEAYGTKASNVAPLVSNAAEKAAAGITRPEATAPIHPEAEKKASDTQELPTVAAEFLDRLEAEEVGEVEVKTTGKHGALHSFRGKNGIVRLYSANGPCDNCGGTLDEEGGFFFDQELPDMPLEFCSECLEDMQIQGYQNHRVASASN